jgi:flavorubredoxin
MQSNEFARRTIMHDVIEIKPDVFWIGAEDPDLRTFDDLFPT